jgi:hypothetical protein
MKHAESDLDPRFTPRAFAGRGSGRGAGDPGPDFEAGRLLWEFEHGFEFRWGYHFLASVSPDFWICLPLFSRNRLPFNTIKPTFPSSETIFSLAGLLPCIIWDKYEFIFFCHAGGQFLNSLAAAPDSWYPQGAGGRSIWGWASYQSTISRSISFK